MAGRFVKQRRVPPQHPTEPCALLNLGIQTFVNGTPMSPVQINTVAFSPRQQRLTPPQQPNHHANAQRRADRRHPDTHDRKRCNVSMHKHVASHKYLLKLVGKWPQLTRGGARNPRAPCTSRTLRLRFCRASCSPVSIADTGWRSRRSLPCGSLMGSNRTI